MGLQVPSKSSGSTPWIRWNSALPLHGPGSKVPHPAPTCASVSPSSSRSSIWARVAWVSRCSVTSRATTTTPVTAAARALHGAERERDGDGQSVESEHLELEVLDPGPRRAQRRAPELTSACRCSGHKMSRVRNTTSSERPPEQALGGRRPGRDPAFGVAQEDGVVGQLDHRPKNIGGFGLEVRPRLLGPHCTHPAVLAHRRARRSPRPAFLQRTRAGAHVSARAGSLCPSLGRCGDGRARASERSADGRQLLLGDVQDACLDAVFGTTIEKFWTPVRLTEMLTRWDRRRPG